MNGNRQAEIHYINTGFPYTVTESFMDLFENLAYDQSPLPFSEPFHEQGNQYWPTMQSNTYKYTFSGEESNSYCSFDPIYSLNEYIHRMDEGRGIWDENSECTPLNTNTTTTTDSPNNITLNGNDVNSPNSNPSTEERFQENPSNSSSLDSIWQDYIDPDNMSYEELLDLGETVGSQSKGLTKERISLLPVSKYKCNFFYRKKSKRERCVVCQMDYKRGDRQMTLPCNHFYHATCVTKWLTINKVCPVCFAEVIPEGQRKN